MRCLPDEIVLNVALLSFRAISPLILAQNIFLSISLRRSFCKRLKIKIYKGAKSLCKRDKKVEQGRDLRDSKKIQFTITHPVFGPHPTWGHRGLWLRLNRKILTVDLLRLRSCAAKQIPLGCSIGAAKSNPNPGAIQVYEYFPISQVFVCKNKHR
ncbi:MAG: hypothetical protein C4531_00260 [Desulfurivibrio sp.]|nr:MAG: hypothetical protein C4531_00260 [Desulfurivibrio sp.]